MLNEPKSDLFPVSEKTAVKMRSTSSRTPCNIQKFIFEGIRDAKTAESFKVLAFIQEYTIEPICRWVTHVNHLLSITDLAAHDGSDSRHIEICLTT